MPTPPPRPKLPPPLPGRKGPRRSKPQYLAVGVGVLAVTALLVAIFGIASLSNPNPNAQDGKEPEPAPMQPAGSSVPSSAIPDVVPIPNPSIPSQPSSAAPPSAAAQPELNGPPAANALPPPSTGSPQDVIAQVKPSVVLILGRRPGEISSGTGFVVEGGRIATCNHVVSGATELLVVADGKQLPATVAAADPHTDLAVLTCAAALPAPLPLADGAQVRDGDEIAVTGYPVVGKMIGLGYEPTPSTTRGTVSAHRKRKKEDGGLVDELQIDAAINPGNSGGPVYSTRDGSVIGIASSKLVEEQGMGFAISVEMLRRLLGR